MMQIKHKSHTNMQTNRQTHTHNIWKLLEEEEEEQEKNAQIRNFKVEIFFPWFG